MRQAEKPVGVAQGRLASRFSGGLANVVRGHPLFNGLNPGEFVSRVTGRIGTGNLAIRAWRKSEKCSQWSMLVPGESGLSPLVIQTSTMFQALRQPWLDPQEELQQRWKNGQRMKFKIAIIQVVMLCSISTAVMAQTSNPDIPHGAQVDRPDAPDESSHGVMPVPLAESSPTTMPGGLYRLGNGYLNCPDTLPVTNGQPNLRSCTFIKDVH